MRAVHRNPPPAGKRRSRGRGANEPKSVTPRQRVSEHPGEWLTVSNKRLFCKACREELSLVSSVINNHLNRLQDYIETSVMMQYNYR